MHRQEGFPLDISLLECQERGLLPDIMELFAEATIYAELPMVEDNAPQLFTQEAKIRWLLYLRQYPEDDQFQAAEKILLDKRRNGHKLNMQLHAHERHYHRQRQNIPASS